MPHDIAMGEVLFTERALSTFLGGLHPKIDPAPDQYEGNRAGNGTLDILIHNNLPYGNISSTGPKNNLISSGT